jgi:hypothetical protein
MGRRAEGIPVLQQKALDAFTEHNGAAIARQLMTLFSNRTTIESNQCTTSWARS